METDSRLIPNYMKSSQPSEYHDNCVPKKSIPEASRNYSQGDYAKCDQVGQDTIWKQAVEGEKRGLKNWEENWGFLTEFDDKGRPKEVKTVQEEEISQFTDELPNTNAGNYGYRTKKDIGQRIQNLEYKFYSDKRRRKMGDDLICY
ncbi:uncharacterized protein C2orf50-like isoform X2 [Lineus longissimus]|uniref:uncharacterized protein C2orf50-like isoform X2 n=1 Tax=Lineus longissimus TaxID=88925 RepID=UPI002B4CB579